MLLLTAGDFEPGVAHVDDDDDEDDPADEDDADECETSMGTSNELLDEALFIAGALAAAAPVPAAAFAAGLGEEACASAAEPNGWCPLLLVMEILTCCCMLLAASAVLPPIDNLCVVCCVCENGVHLASESVKMVRHRESAREKRQVCVWENGRVFFLFFFFVSGGQCPTNRCT